MRESCQCGGFIAAFSYKRVRDWRTNHVHEGRPVEEPQMEGSHAHIEQAYEPGYQIGGEGDVPVVMAKAGFKRG